MIKYYSIMLLFLATFLLAFLATVFVTPMVIKFSSSYGFLDQPNERKIHTTPIPRLGGIAVYIGFVLALLFFSVFSNLKGMHINFALIFGIWASSTLVFVIGIIDDIKGLRPIVKLFWQVIASMLVIYFGVGINFISNPFNGLMPLSVFIGIPLTILWLSGITNAINLIDGLDGLAAGVTAIASGTLFFVALRTHEIGAAFILLALAGTSLGFLKYNFFPAKIFLGDSGSYFLGFILASSAIIGVLKTTLIVALIIPILILGVPIFDTVFAIGRRLGNGKNPFIADDKHIHHMLLRAGFTQREAVFAIYIACFLLSMGALLMALQK